MNHLLIHISKPPALDHRLRSRTAPRTRPLPTLPLLLLDGLQEGAVRPHVRLLRVLLFIWKTWFHTPAVTLTSREALVIWAAAAAKSLQSCPTLCDPIDGGPPGSPVPGILQARDELEIYKLWLRGPRTRTMDLDSWFRNINPPWGFSLIGIHR